MNTQDPKKIKDLQNENQAQKILARSANFFHITASEVDALIQKFDVLEEWAQNLDSAVAVPVTDLRTQIESMILMPATQILEGGKQVALEAAGQLQKTVTVQTSEGGLCLDSTLVRDLSDVLLHLVRNAVFHGIETEGGLDLSLCFKAGQCVLEVHDNGRGLQEDVILKKAQEKGIQTKDIYKILSTPGFSTAADVTAYAGQGIGLNVVEATAFRWGGRVEVESTPQLGTTFRVHIPLTFAKMPLMPVKAGCQWFAFQTSDIVKVHAKKPAVSFYDLRRHVLESQGDLAFSEPALYLEDRQGSFWGADEVLPQQSLLVRAVSSQMVAQHGIVGVVRIPESPQQGFVLDVGR